jgi:hypothetical protein
VSLIAAAHASDSVHPVAPPPRPPASGWWIQVGSYATEPAARAAAAAARHAAEAGDARVEAATVSHKTVWRAQVMGLRAIDAQDACSALARRKTPCMVMRPDTRDVASR